MTEDFLQYLWKFGLFENFLTSTDGQEIEVISKGTHNSDSGPDFFNAKVRIGTTIWAGNIEIHLHSSHWELHKHNTDKAYDNVILHIVFKHDKEIYRTNGEKITTIELPVNQIYFNNYQRLTGNLEWIPCQKLIGKINPFEISFFLSQLLIERLERKSELVYHILKETNNNWEEAFYRSLAGTFGLKANSIPFILSASNLPLNIINKHRHDLFQIEALMFGTAGFLSQNCDDDYFLKLHKEFIFLSSKYSLKPIGLHIWKFMRLRPGSFPTIRIAQFAALLHQFPVLFSRLISIETTINPSEFHTVKASAYWNTHFLFGKTSGNTEKKMGEETANLIMINSIIPFLFVFGKEKGDYKLIDKALSIFDLLKTENNHIIRKWAECGIKAKNASQSQALNHLFTNYCLNRNCLNCNIGHSLIQAKI
jgi:hypothetical protein